MRALEFITGHVIYNPAYIYKFQLKTTFSLLKLAPSYNHNYLQLPLRQWSAGNVCILVLPSWKVNIAENTVAVMGL